MNSSCTAVLVVVFLSPLATFAQDASGLASRIEAARYNPLARQARIQGDVELRSGRDEITVINGHPLLAQEAVSNLKGLGKFSDVEIEAIYHFAFVDNTEIRVTKRIEKRGNRFERTILRALMRKTERVVEYQECVEKPILPKNKIELGEDRLEVWIYASNVCLQTTTSQMARY